MEEMMFDKLFEKKGHRQSQNMSGIGGGGLQSQAGRDSTAIQQGQNFDPQQELTGFEVVTLLAQLQMAITASAIDRHLKEEMQDYLKVVSREAQKEIPNKELMTGNLKQVGEMMINLNATTEAGKGLWQTGEKIFKDISPWLGVAAAVFGVVV
jgi:hypothetical protein